jgi:predicted AAA+ superfamily ATPase
MGPRQVGKSTLVRRLVEEGLFDQYLTLDDLTTLSSARSDPQGFISALPDRTVIDEIQRAPELLLPIKASVDRDRRPGRFLLTGSAAPEAIPQVSEALAGRVQMLTLWPFSQGELAQREERFIADLFSARAPHWKTAPLTRVHLLERIARGGYPEAITRKPGRRGAWFDSYVITLLLRDVQDFARIDGTVELPKLLRFLALRTAQPINLADVSRELGLPQSTTKRYAALLHAAFLVRSIPPWFVNATKRLVKAPKWVLTDSGLATHLCGLDQLPAAHPMAGHLLETFVACELLRQLSWNEHRIALHHFRTHAGEEVDWVLERADGVVVGIEVKLSAQVAHDDFKGLRVLRDLAKERFHRGVILYSGTELVAFGPGLYAAPIGALWC